MLTGDTAFWSSREHTHLELVGRVERDFCYFAVSFSDFHHVTQNHLGELQKSGFGSISNHNSLRTRRENIREMCSTHSLVPSGLLSADQHVARLAM